MYHTIYKITNMINGKFYYGVHSTEQINDNYMGSGNGIRNAIKKYGIENFKKEIICVFEDREQALTFEKSLVSEQLILDPMCYNSTVGGNNPSSRKGKVSKTNLLKGDQRTENQKKAALLHSNKMKSKAPWNKGSKGKQIAWNKGISNPILKNIANLERTCPHCNKIGKGSSMLRWHFNNCKQKI